MTRGDGGSPMLNALGEEGSSGRAPRCAGPGPMHACVRTGRGGGGGGGRVRRRRGQGRKGRRRAARGEPARRLRLPGPALPPAARARGPGRARAVPPAVCISLAGVGARLERNGPGLERCLFFLTSQCGQTTPWARRRDPADPALGKGVRTGASRATRGAGSGLWSPTHPQRPRLGEGSRLARG